MRQDRSDTVPARPVASGAVLIAAALFAGCQATAPTICTQVGAESGVVFEYAKVVRDGSRGPLTVRACVESACETRKVGLNQGFYSMVAGREELQTGGGEPVKVRLTIHDVRGHAVFAGETTVTPSKLQPNGPSCPPTAWAGRVNARGEGQLVAQPKR